MRNKYVSNLKRSVLKRFGAVAMAVSVTATMGCFNQDVVRADTTDAAEAEASVYADVSENDDNAVAVVDSGSCGNNATYTLDSNGLLTISGSGEIAGDAFRGSSYISNRYAYTDKIKKLVIENGITVIGSEAFEDCENLADITMPNSVVQIKESAFAGCKKLEGVIIPESVTEIGSWAFSNCGRMESIYIPKNVEYIGTYAFTGIISEITVADENKYYNSKNNCNAIIETATDTLIIGCGKTIIPDDVTKIGDYAFGGCSGLINIIIPEGVTKIGDGAFHGCSSLTSITIPESVTWIGNGAFYACGQMESIHISKNVEHIGMSAFSDIRTNITVADENTYYDSRNNCNAIIETATNILITGCGETVIPNDVVQIGVGAFVYCESLTSITIPESVMKISNGAFSDCSSLTSITIPKSVTEIGSLTFYGCSSLTSITIPEGVTCIEEFAFENCSLTNIIIPKSVTSIGEYAFGGNKMDSITILNKNVVLVGRAFGIVEKNCTIHGYTGSTAEKYATEYGIAFKAIESTDGSEDNGNSGADTENPGSGDAGNSGSNTENPGGEDAGNGGSNTGNSGTGNGTTGGTTGGSTSGNTAGSGSTGGGTAGGGSTGGATDGGGASVSGGSTSISGGSTGNVSTGASTSTDEKKDDSKVDKKVTTNKDGSVKEVVKEKETNSKGKEVTVTTTTEKDKKGNVTSVTEKKKIDNIASDATATVTVKTDKKGSTTATASIEKKIASEKKTTTISSSMIEQIKEAAGTDVDITMTVKDENGNTKYKVKADTADLKKGKDLYIYKLNTKTGEYVMVNDKTYSVSDKGNVSVKLDNKGTYELVSATDAKKIEKKILATVQAKKTAASMKKGKKTSIALSNKLNMSNVKSITYSTDSKSVATVSKKGAVTAKGKGTTTIKATVTLKNGKTKTVKMKVTVK